MSRMMLSPMRRSTCGGSPASLVPPRSGSDWPKAAAELIPLAHPIGLSRVAVDFELDKKRTSIRIVARVECRGQTGVEMEALTAAAVGLLTIYDMVKAVDRGMRLTEIRLEEKHGGKSGVFRRRRS